LVWNKTVVPNQGTAEPQGPIYDTQGAAS